MENGSDRLAHSVEHVSRLSDADVGGSSPPSIKNTFKTA